MSLFLVAGSVGLGEKKKKKEYLYSFHLCPAKNWLNLVICSFYYVGMLIHVEMFIFFQPSCRCFMDHQWSRNTATELFRQSVT